jgi:hypothetical protein
VYREKGHHRERLCGTYLHPAFGRFEGLFIHLLLGHPFGLFFRSVRIRERLDANQPFSIIVSLELAFEKLGWGWTKREKDFLIIDTLLAFPILLEDSHEL